MSKGLEDELDEMRIEVQKNIKNEFIQKPRLDSFAEKST